MEQLDLFTDNGELKQDLLNTKQELERVRKGIFRRYGELSKEIINIKKDMKQILKLML